MKLKERCILNNVVLIGRPTKEPELKYLKDGDAAVCNFTLAVDKDLSKAKKEEFEANNKPTADFINIVVWNRVAENCAKHLGKGKLVAVQGRIQTRSWDDDGERKYTTEVIAYQVEFLEWKDSNNNNDIENNEQESNDELPF